MWWLAIFLSCVSVGIYAQSNTDRVDLSHSIVIKFDLITDENISTDDPRVKSIIYSAKSYTGSKILVSYINPNAAELASRLAQVFMAQHLYVLKPQKLGLVVANNNDNKYVQVIINYSW